MIQREIIVDNQDAGLRLDHFLTEQVTELSRSRLQALVKDGHILVNGKNARPNDKVRAGDTISVSEPPLVASDHGAEDIALDILHEDDDLIVVNKPAGLVVHPAVGHMTGTLVNALLHHCGSLSGIGGVERPGIVHRLDKETSGCMVAAKTDAAHQSLATQFAGREVEKIYLALATGRLAKKNGMVEVAVDRHPVHRQKMAVARLGKGKEARTEWKVLAELDCGTLIECKLHTGRTHQIRVHMKHLGHPLLGDEVYGRRGDYVRQMLHSWKLGFTHPRTGERVAFTAPIPADFQALGVKL